MDNKSKIKSIYSNFTFIGQPYIKKEGGRYYSNTINENGYVNSRIQFGIKASENNLVFVELSGGYNSNNPPVIKTLDNDGNKIEVQWKDRFNSEIVEMVKNMNCVRINLENSDLSIGKKFIITMFSSCYDAVEYLKDNLTDEKRLYVSGKVEFSRYQDKNKNWQVSIKYIPNVIRLANDDEEDTAIADMSFIFDKDSWDESTLKEDGKVAINGYVTSNDKSVKGNIFLNNLFILDFSKTDLESDLGKGMFEYYKNLFKAKSGEYWETAWHCNIVRGYESEEITMDTLSKDQKIQIQLGITTFEEIKEDMRKMLIKNRINEIRLFRPINKFKGDKGNSPILLSVYEEDDFIIPIEESKTEHLENVERAEKSNDDKVSDSVLNELFPPQN